MAAAAPAPIPYYARPEALALALDSIQSAGSAPPAVPCFRRARPPLGPDPGLSDLGVILPPASH